MVWILLLCHFIADYPLQTDAIVIAKKHFWGLIAHVMVHFLTMLVVMVGLLQINLMLVLPSILILTVFHFADCSAVLPMNTSRIFAFFDKTTFIKN